VSVARATRLRRCRNSGEGAGANDETENRVDTFARPSEQASQATPLRAALSGKCCVAEGVSARGNTPILALCRALMAAGYDPDRALHVYRGSVLAVIVSAIGKAAKLTVEDDSRGKPRFRLKRDRTGGTALLERHSVPRDSDGCPTKVRSGTPRHPPKADRNEILVAATDPLSGGFQQ
jgi:hypothetical protein